MTCYCVKKELQLTINGDDYRLLGLADGVFCTLISPRKMTKILPR